MSHESDESSPPMVVPGCGCDRPGGVLSIDDLLMLFLFRRSNLVLLNSFWYSFVYLLILFGSLLLALAPRTTKFAPLSLVNRRAGEDAADGDRGSFIRVTRLKPACGG